MTRILFSVMLFIAVISNIHAMRCGTALINEGDSITRMVELCGTPTSNAFENITYINKDGDGMNYYIHANNAGTIDSIEFSRGGLR